MYCLTIKPGKIEQRLNDLKEKPTDLEILSLVKSGNLNAFTEIVNRYQGRIATTVYGILGECQEAEDIGQEVFIRFFKSIGNFRGDAQLSTYLIRIAINLSLNELKRRRRRKLFSYESWFENAKINEDTVKSFGNYEKKELVYYALDKL
jgi:RNA polymerase sigma-70 factor (ECF subfamily)